MFAAIAAFYEGQLGGVVAKNPILGLLARDAQLLQPPAQNIDTAWVQGAAKIGYINDIFELIDAPVLGAQRIVPLHDTVELRRFAFHWALDTTALPSIECAISRRYSVGLVGTTDSGKGTLIDVVIGLLDRCGGQLIVGGRAINHNNIASWQTKIAHFPQTIFLMVKIIAENIAFGTPSDAIDLGRVKIPAAGAGLVGCIATLFDGFNTMAGERGVQLSRGQRQRIGAMRTRYKKAELLVFDEVAVMDAVNRLGPNLTVAHRLSTLVNSDVIYLPKHGRIGDRGSYAELRAWHGVKNAA